MRNGPSFRSARHAVGRARVRPAWKRTLLPWDGTRGRGSGCDAQTMRASDGAQCRPARNGWLARNRALLDRTPSRRAAGCTLPRGQPTSHTCDRRMTPVLAPDAASGISRKSPVASAFRPCSAGVGPISGRRRRDNARANCCRHPTPDQGAPARSAPRLRRLPTTNARGSWAARQTS
jgi:hypothetical protein